jgi:hypothetical protein
MAHQHVIRIPEPGVAGLLPGWHLVTAWDDGRTTIQWNPKQWGGAWGPPVEVDAQTETWTECPPNDDDTFAVFRPGTAS